MEINHLSEEKREELYQYLLAMADSDLENDEIEDGDLDFETLLEDYSREAKAWMLKNEI